MVIAVVVAASSRPMGGGLVKNLGYFSVPALIVLVVLAVVGWRWWGSRRPATQPSSSST
jgi:hypothetical protein